MGATRNSAITEIPAGLAHRENNVKGSKALICVAVRGIFSNEGLFF
ncbi:MAG: hypothetical protein N4J56_007871 [Chroococcidiopsis sp. SAG 2025]|nr:hypothetical protein [Chroococcidiopsis sp. SAG 2025]